MKKDAISGRFGEENAPLAPLRPLRATMRSIESVAGCDERRTPPCFAKPQTSS